MFGCKFSDRPLRKALIELYQDHTIGDSQSLLCIPNFDHTQGTAYRGVKARSKGRPSRASQCAKNGRRCARHFRSADIFPLVQIDQENGRQYVDGRVWANNPAIVGSTESIWHFVGEGKAYDFVELLSVSSLNYSSGRPPLLQCRRGFIRWAPDLFDCLKVSFILDAINSLAKFLRKLFAVEIRNRAPVYLKNIGWH